MWIGVDLMDVGELDRLMTRPWFRDFTYAPGEQAVAAGLKPGRRREFLAGRFAAKEAVLKVLNHGLFQGIAPREIELTRSPSGAVGVRLHGAAAAAADGAGMGDLAVSLTHKRDAVVAVAIGWPSANRGSVRA